MLTTHEKLDKILEAIKQLLNSSQQSDMENTPQSPLGKRGCDPDSSPSIKRGSGGVSDDDQEADSSKATLKRLGFMAVLDVVLFVATALIYSFDSAVFGISLGFFVASMIITFVLMIDWKVIPGDTIKKISDNSVALAILLFIIACSIWVGILIGEGYRPQALQGEAKHSNVESVGNAEPSELDNR